MIWGMSVSTFTFVHVLLSLVAIASGLVMMFGLIARKRLENWTALFLGSSIATTITGFGFPFEQVTPAHVVGAISAFALVAALVARYVYQLRSWWRRTYVVSASLALYLNVLVAVIQAFRKVPALKALAPTESEPPFLIAQVAALACVVALALAAAARFRDVPPKQMAARA